MNENFHQKTIEESLHEMDSSIQGLSSKEAQVRFDQYGTNALDKQKKPNVWQRFGEQMKNPMIIVLVFAGAISGAFGEWADMGIILAVVLINGIMGVVQEGKAEQALEALQSMSSPQAKVRRNGQRQIISTEDIVPGDIVELEAGDFVPADMRLIEGASLKVEEAALTGESVPVEKNAEPILAENLVLGDRTNMVYAGTSVAYGRGIGLVNATGMHTEIGKIAHNIAKEKEQPTPMQKQLAGLSKVLSVIVLLVCVIIFILSIVQNGWNHVLSTFLMAVSLAVAAIPEGLPAIVTIVMALGVQRMAAKNAIIRKLSAVETLGSASVICSDKTGTLTQNKMTVMQVYTENTLQETKTMGPAPENPFLEAMAFCNDARQSVDKDENLIFLGDPTETSLLAYAHAQGFSLAEKLAMHPRIHEFPFDSERKRMSTFHQIEGKIVQYTKGAPDVLISRCNRILLQGQVLPIEAVHIEDIKKANHSMAQSALRVLGIAMSFYETIPKDMNQAENDMIFLGLVGMIDPARPEVEKAVKICRKAGIRPIMITGDHVDTAVAIAKELGILEKQQLAITGVELDNISEKEFEPQVEQYSVYARVSPEHKVRIVKAWQKKGKVSAMTGDGVNDAPALKAADIGIGMGITGTDVTKNVADMILTDDNFATIVLAVEEGRKIYANTRKCVQFLLSSNMAEVLAVLVSILINIPFLHTIHILWINLVSDTFPALALGIEPKEDGVMEQRPRQEKEGIFSHGLGIQVLYQGVFIAAIALIAWYLGHKTSNEVAITMAFCTLTIAQMFHTLNVRSRKSIFHIGWFSNHYALAAIGVSILLTVGITMLPGINHIFHLTALNLGQWLIVFGLSFLIIPLVEMIKLFTTFKI